MNTQALVQFGWNTYRLNESGNLEFNSFILLEDLDEETCKFKDKELQTLYEESEPVEPPSNIQPKFITYHAYQKKTRKLKMKKYLNENNKN